MNTQSNFARLMRYAGRRRFLTYLSWILSALSALMALVPFVFIWQILYGAMNGAETQDMIRAGWLAVACGVASALIYVGALMCSHYSAFRVASNMRRDLLEHIGRMPFGAAQKIGSGKLRKIVTDSTAATETYLAHRLPDKAGAIATPIGLLVLLLVFDWRLGLLSLIPVALAFVIVGRMTGRRMQQSMKEYQDALADMANEAVEYVRGIPIVKTFGQTVFTFRRFRDAIERYEQWAVAYTKALRLPMTLYLTLINSVFAFLIAGAIAAADGGQLSSAQLVNLLFYVIVSPALTTTLTRIMFMAEDNMIVADALQRVDTVLDVPALPTPRQALRPSDGTITFAGVSYSYDGSKDAVSDISLQIQPGQTTALVGPSGSGKTTLMSLLSRFFDPDKGCIRIGDVDIRDMDKNNLMNMVSFVFQDSQLLKTSLLENVRLARPDASREEVMAALQAAQCMDIVEKLPEGADTVIGEKGVFLSGGERQRVAVARAILKNSPIVVLDEATAFADPDNEAKVRAAFAEMAKGRTVIMIAHRLSSIRGADEIFVLEDGRLREQGAHNSLLRENGLYRKMWDEFSQTIDWKVENAS